MLLVGARVRVGFLLLCVFVFLVLFYFLFFVFLLPVADTKKMTDAF